MDEKQELQNIERGIYEISEFFTLGTITFHKDNFEIDKTFGNYPQLLKSEEFAIFDPIVGKIIGFYNFEDNELKFLSKATISKKYLLKPFKIIVEKIFAFILKSLDFYKIGAEESKDSEEIN